MIWAMSILGAIVLAVVGGFVGIIVAYIVLALMNVSEFEGKRGLTAILFGFLIGAPLGAYWGFRIVWMWMR